MKKALLAGVVLSLIGGPLVLGADLVNIPMNQQINLGGGGQPQSLNGDAIYTPSYNASPVFGQPGRLSFLNNEYAHKNLDLNDDGTGAAWWYMYVDLNLAGIGSIDVSMPGAMLDFDTRYFQHGSNTNQYGDAPVFVRIYTYAPDGVTYLGNRDYSIVYATQPPWNNPPWPTWTHVTIDINASPHSDGGSLDMTKINRIRWYGTDWSGMGDDAVDVKNLVITPEPVSMILLGLGGLVMLRRRRA